MWKNIVGYESRYQVNELGQIRSLRAQSIEREKIISLTPNARGYMTVSLYLNGVKNLLKKFSIEEIKDAIDITASKTFDFRGTDGRFKYMCGVLYTTRKKQENG